MSNVGLIVGFIILILLFAAEGGIALWYLYGKRPKGAPTPPPKKPPVKPPAKPPTKPPIKPPTQPPTQPPHHSHPHHHVPPHIHPHKHPHHVPPHGPPVIPPHKVTPLPPPPLHLGPPLGLPKKCPNLYGTLDQWPQWHNPRATYELIQALQKQAANLKCYATRPDIYNGIMVYYLIFERSGGAPNFTNVPINVNTPEMVKVLIGYIEIQKYQKPSVGLGTLINNVQRMALLKQGTNYFTGLNGLLAAIDKAIH